MVGLCLQEQRIRSRHRFSPQISTNVTRISQQSLLHLPICRLVWGDLQLLYDVSHQDRHNLLNNYNYKQFKQYAEWVKHHQAAMQFAAYAHAWKETTDMNIEAGIIINSMPVSVSYLSLKEMS